MVVVTQVKVGSITWNQPEFVIQIKNFNTKRDEENKNRKKSYVYVYTSSFYDQNRIRIYDFQENRSIDKTAKWLENYQGVIECDNYIGNKPLLIIESKFCFHRTLKIE